MNKNVRSLDAIRKIGRGHSLPLEVQKKPEKPTLELREYMQMLGPAPRICLEMLVDLGLTDDEIACYFKMPSAIVTGLRQVWKIHVENGSYCAWDAAKYRNAD